MSRPAAILRSPFLALVCLTLAVGFGLSAAAQGTNAWKGYADGLKNVLRRSPTWDAAARDFEKALRAHAREGNIRLPDYPSVAYYPNLAYGHALLQQSKQDTQNEAALLKRAIAHLGRSLVESPSYAAFITLAQAYQRAGGEHQKSCYSLLNGGTFSFSIEPIKDAKPELKESGEGNFGAGPLQISYRISGGQVVAELQGGNPAELLTENILGNKKFNAGHLAALGDEAGSKLGKNLGSDGTANSVTETASLEPALARKELLLIKQQLGLRVVYRVNGATADGEIPVTGTVRLQAEVDGGRISRWRITDGEGDGAPLIGEGTGSTPIDVRWDTQKQAVADGPHTLHFALEYPGAEGTRTVTGLLRLKIDNPDPAVKLSAQFTDEAVNREVIVRVEATRPLLQRTCGISVLLPGGTPLREPLLLFEDGEQPGEYRFVYTRRYRLPDGFQGTVEISPATLSPIVQRFERVPADRTVVAGPPLALALDVPTSEIALGKDAIAVTVRSEPRALESRELQLEFADPDGRRTRELQPASGTPQQAQKVDYSVKVEDADSEGEGLLRVRYRGRLYLEQKLRIVRSGPQVRFFEIQPSRTIRAGEQADVYLGFSRSVALAPEHVSLVPEAGGEPVLPLKVEVAPSRGLNVYHCVFAPLAGTYQFKLEGARDRHGFAAGFPPGLDRTLRVTPDVRLRLRFGRSRAPVGTTRVYVSVAGDQRAPEVKLFHEGENPAAAPGTRLEPADPPVIGTAPEQEYVYDLKVAPNTQETAQVVASIPGLGPEYSDQRPIQIDGRAPQFSFTGVPSQVVKDINERQITLEVDEELAQLPEVLLQQDGAPNRVLEVRPVSGSSTQWTVSFRPQALPGNVRILVSGRDTAGNTGRNSTGFEVSVAKAAARIRPLRTTPNGNKWGPSNEPHVVELQPLGPVTGEPQLRLLPQSGTPVPIPLEKQGEIYLGKFRVGPGMDGPARLIAEGAVSGVAEVVLDTAPPQLQLRLPDSARVGEEIRIVVLGNELLSSATLKEMTTGTSVRLTASGDREWAGTLVVPANTPSLRLVAEGVDEVGLKATALERTLQVRAPNWEFKVPTIIGLGRLPLVASSAEAPAGTRVRVEFRRGTQVLPLTFTLQRAQAGQAFSGRIDVTEAIVSGDVEVVLLVNDQVARSLPARIDTEAPRLGPINIRRVDEKTVELTVSLENRDAVTNDAVRALVKWSQPGRQEDRLTLRRSEDPFTFRSTLNTEGVPQGEYPVTVTAVDEAGNQAERTGPLRIESLDAEVIWEQPEPDAALPKLPEIRYRVRGANSDHVQFSLRRTDGGSSYVYRLPPGQPAADDDPGLEILVAPQRLAPTGFLQLTLPPDLQAGDYLLEAHLVVTGQPTELKNRMWRFKYAPRTDASQRWAILVAVSNYTVLGELKSTYTDAAVLRQALLRHGYSKDHIVTITDKDPGRPDLPDPVVAATDYISLFVALRNALRQASQQGVSYITFAFFGHGVQKGKDNYILPANSILEQIDRSGMRLEDVFNLISKEWVVREGSDRHLLMLIDACRTGVNQGVAPYEPSPPPNMTVTAYYACGPGERSAELQTPGMPPLDFVGGLFTRAFVRLLDEGGVANWVEFESRFDHVVGSWVGRLPQQKQRPERHAQPVANAKYTLKGFFDLTATSAANGMPGRSGWLLRESDSVVTRKSELRRRLGVLLRQSAGS